MAGENILKYKNILKKKIIFKCDNILLILVFTVFFIKQMQPLWTTDVFQKH